MSEFRPDIEPPACSYAVLRWARGVLFARGMGYPLRWYLPGVTYESTIRTLDSRFLLRPDDASRNIVHCVIARALRLYPNVHLHNYDAQSNHLHSELSSTDGESVPYFLQYVHGNIAREVGHLRGWLGKFWSRRVRVIPIVDDDAIIQRFRYILAQGVKSGLVKSPRDWPGACAVNALLGSMQVTGSWTSRQRIWRNARRAHPSPTEALTESVEAPLHPITPWQHLSHDELVARHVAMIADLEREQADGGVLGVDRLTTADPLAEPAETASSAAPACHASSSGARRRFMAAFRVFCDTFIAAASIVHKAIGGRRPPIPSSSQASAAPTLVDLSSGSVCTGPTASQIVAAFPIGSCPRPRSYVRPIFTTSAARPPWTEPLAFAA